MIVAALLGGQRGAFHQRQGVLAAGERFHLAQGGLQVGLQLGRQALVVPGGGGVGGQEQDVGQVVARPEARRLEVQDGRDEHDPVQVHAVALLQVAGKPGRPRGAVALADQELGRVPALVARGVQADEIAHRLDVLLEAVELARFFARHGA